MAVNGPPGAVQHLIKVGGVVARDGQATGQGGVDMGVGVDEGRHDDAALGVDDLGLGIFGFQRGFLAHLHDLRALVGHGAMLVVAPALRVPGDEPSVGNKCHDTSPFTDDKRKGVPALRNTCRAKETGASPCARHSVAAVVLCSVFLYLYFKGRRPKMQEKSASGGTAAENFSAGGKSCGKLADFRAGDPRRDTPSAEPSSKQPRCICRWQRSGSLNTAMA